MTYTTPEMSKRLKEAGVEQIPEGKPGRVLDNKSNEVVSLFTVPELLEMLDNDELMEYFCEKMNMSTEENCASDIYDIIRLFRSPDALAEVVIWKKGLER